jgi:CubicO group peptidase (beta-lactamase class C family)
VRVRAASSFVWLLVIEATLGGIALSSSPAQQRGNPTSPPGLDSLFGELRRDSAGDVKGVLVLRNDVSVAEAYFNGDDSTTLHDIRSATKSITSLLVGIALEHRLIATIDARLSSLLPMPANGVGTVTMRDLLTMRSGLDSDDRDSQSTGNENRLDQSDDWLGFAARVPLVRPPGQSYVYSSLNAYLAGAVVEQAAGVPLAQYASEWLFGPLGIVRFGWRRGPRGEGVGQGNLSIRLRDMGRIGELMLHEGTVGGRRVVGARWIHDSLEPIVAIGSVDPYADSYGYMWYLRKYPIGRDTVVVHFASGNGGNKIYVIPQEHLVIAVTSSAYNARYGQRRSERILLTILTALSATGS